MLTCFTFPPKLASLAAGGGGIGNAMADYRVYLVGEDGHFYEAVPMTCSDDAEAIERAQQLAIGQDVELWQLDRKIATFANGRMI
jgi:hypothetical protein